MVAPTVSISNSEATVLSLPLQLCLLLGLIFLRGNQRPKELVHVDKVVAIVVLVGGVMDSVVAGPHDWVSPVQSKAPLSSHLLKSEQKCITRDRLLCIGSVQQQCTLAQTPGTHSHDVSSVPFMCPMESSVRLTSDQGKDREWRTYLPCIQSWMLVVHTPVAKSSSSWVRKCMGMYINVQQYGIAWSESQTCTVRQS